MTILNKVILVKVINILCTHLFDNCLLPASYPAFWLVMRYFRASVIYFFVLQGVEHRIQLHLVSSDTHRPLQDCEVSAFIW